MFAAMKLRVFRQVHEDDGDVILAAAKVREVDQVLGSQLRVRVLQND
jgi:hypothetical protein